MVSYRSINIVLLISHRNVFMISFTSVCSAGEILKLCCRFIQRCVSVKLALKKTSRFICIYSYSGFKVNRCNLYSACIHVFVHHWYADLVCMTYIVRITVCVIKKVGRCVPGSRPAAGVWLYCGGCGSAAAPSLSSEPPFPEVCFPAAEVGIRTPLVWTSTRSLQPVAGRYSSLFPSACLPAPSPPSLDRPPLPHWCFLRLQ